MSTTTLTVFAGVNTTPFSQCMEGQPILISFADVMRRPGWWANEMLPRLEAGKYPHVMLDSGAFTEMKVPGFKVDLHEYAAFAKQHQHLFSSIVNLDDIKGDIQKSQHNLRVLESYGLSVIPVFHQGEPWSVLQEMVQTYSYIGVGTQWPRRGITAFLSDFFKKVQEFGGAKVHGFGLTRYAHHGFPFHTTDSTTWIAEYRAMKKELDTGAAKTKQWGVGPLMGTFISELSQQQLIHLVCASYQAAWSIYAGSVLESEAKSQARTVLCRFSQGTFEQVIETLGLDTTAARWAAECFDPYELVDL